MKNKQINKVLLMFFLSFTLFFSVSNAEFTTSGVENTSATSSAKKLTASTEYAGYTLSQILNMFNNKDSSDEELGLYETMISTLDSAGYNILYWQNKVNSKTEFAIWNKSQQSDIGKYTNSSYETFIYSPVKTDDKFIIVVFNRATYGYIYREFTITSDGVFEINYDDYSKNLTGINASVKELTLSSGYLLWDGTSYYYKVETDEPDFEGITDSDKAIIINSVVNSDEFKSLVPKKYRNQFFIVKNEWTNRYKVYFYPEQYYLKGRIFEEGSVEDVPYKSYKIVAFDSDNFLWDLWQSINPFDYYVFSGYFNEDGTFTSYFYENKDSHILNQYYFSYQDEPIVYTSRDIGFLIYKLEDNSYSEDVDNSISSTILTDDDGNTIEIVIPEDTSTLSQTPWERFVSLIQNIPSKIVEGFQNATGISQIITVLNPIQGAFWAIFDVLISAVTLISRAVVFVYTLPTIEASRALFDVDVAATEGLSFVGNSWGNKFLEGFDMIKGFSWNGLNLWNLFSAFVVLMVAIQAVKYVRKHYHY